MSGMGLWFWRFEEGVWKLPHPHGYGRGDDSVFRVHHSVKKRLQVGLRVAPYMDDLVSGRRVMLAWIHCPKTVCKLLSVQKMSETHTQKISLSQSQTFFFHKKRKAGNIDDRQWRVSRVILMFNSRVLYFLPKCVSCRSQQLETAFSCRFLLAYL